MICKYDYNVRLTLSYLLNVVNCQVVSSGVKHSFVKTVLGGIHPPSWELTILTVTFSGTPVFNGAPATQRIHRGLAMGTGDVLRALIQVKEKYLYKKNTA